MQITDEMVEAGWHAAGIVSKAHVRNMLEAVAPLIAKAEAEECAEVATNLRHPDYSSENVDWIEGALHAAAAIRARHATPTPSTPQEK